MNERIKGRRITIDAIIVKGNAILLIKRAHEPYKDMWALPGGYIEWDETAEEAVIREVREETGLTVTNMYMLTVYSKPERDPDQKITIAYAVEATGEATAGDDASECQWFELDNLPELAFDHKKIIEAYKEI